MLRVTAAAGLVAPAVPWSNGLGHLQHRGAALHGRAQRRGVRGRWRGDIVHCIRGRHDDGTVRIRNAL